MVTSLQSFSSFFVRLHVCILLARLIIQLLCPCPTQNRDSDRFRWVSRLLEFTRARHAQPFSISSSSKPCRPCSSCGSMLWSCQAANHNSASRIVASREGESTNTATRPAPATDVRARRGRIASTSVAASTKPSNSSGTAFLSAFARCEKSASPELPLESYMCALTAANLVAFFASDGMTKIKSAFDVIAYFKQLINLVCVVCACEYPIRDL